MASEVVLSVRNLNVEYRSARGRVRAVQDVTFELAQREALALIGESGSGKSTVALTLMRLLPGNAEVTAGEIRYGAGSAAVDVLKLSPEALRAFRWSDARSFLKARSVPSTR